MSAPVAVSMPMIGPKAAPALKSIALIIPAPATARPAMTSIETREPNRAMQAPPVSAPTAPPRLKAVMPVLAIDDVKPAPVNSDGTQAKQRYTASRQEK